MTRSSHVQGCCSCCSCCACCSCCTCFACPSDSPASTLSLPLLLNLNLLSLSLLRLEKLLLTSAGGQVSSVVPGFGVLPKKVFTVEAARAALEHDGAVVLAGLETALHGKDAFKDTALQLPHQLFGDRLLAVRSTNQLLR